MTGESVATVVERLHGTDEAVVPVLDGNGIFVGVVLATELAYALAHVAESTIDSLVRPAPATLAGDESLERAGDLMTDPAIAMLPVLSPDGRLAGVVSRRDVLDAYRSIAEA